MKSHLLLLILIAAVVGCSHTTPAPMNEVNEHPEVYVKYEVADTSIRYYLAENNLIYPGTIRDGKHFVWEVAPITKSEYMYGRPNVRSPLLQMKDVEFKFEQPPEGLKRISVPRDK